jgi:ClpP class serine protease
VEAERIINVLREYSGTGKYWAFVPARAKSAATMICFGAEKVLMGATSELGPIDPQIAFSEAGELKRFSLYNIVTSYEELFKKAVEEKQGNLEPYLQQLHHYDEREIREFNQLLSWPRILRLELWSLA